ncbi:hypothetical protein [Streptomyces buecherae]|uniref:hypothetical protein n=1 Tax=Streptomyces buecherae TaxID=2763006 RepID=UPI0020B7256B|nr:hypothetical protein [Streptomyces buecherae]
MPKTPTAPAKRTAARVGTPGGPPRDTATEDTPRAPVGPTDHPSADDATAPPPGPEAAPTPSAPPTRADTSAPSPANPPAREAAKPAARRRPKAAPAWAANKATPAAPRPKRGTGAAAKGRQPADAHGGAEARGDTAPRPTIPTTDAAHPNAPEAPRTATPEDAPDGRGLTGEAPAVASPEAPAASEVTDGPARAPDADRQAARQAPGVAAADDAAPAAPSAGPPSADRPPGGRRPVVARWRAVRSRLPGWWPVAFGAALGLAGGGTYGALATPEYTATSYVVAAAKDGTDPATALGFAQAYGRITTGGAVLGAAQRTTGTPVDDLRASVRTATSPDAPMIEVTGADARAGRAAATANAVARALTEHANRSARSTGVRLTVFAQAVPPTAPTSPSLPISLAVGGCAGGLLGALALLVRPRPAPEPHQASTLDPLPTPGSEPR